MVALPFWEVPIIRGCLVQCFYFMIDRIQWLYITAVQQAYMYQGLEEPIACACVYDSLFWYIETGLCPVSNIFIVRRRIEDGPHNIHDG